MPIKRRLAKGRAYRITPEMVEQYRVATETRETYVQCVRGACEAGHRREPCTPCAQHREASRALHEALRWKPWLPSPIDAVSDEPPGWMATADQIEGWRLARQVREELEGML